MNLKNGSFAVVCKEKELYIELWKQKVIDFSETVKSKNLNFHNILEPTILLFPNFEQFVVDKSNKKDF